MQFGEKLLQYINEIAQTEDEQRKILRAVELGALTYLSKKRVETQEFQTFCKKNNVDPKQIRRLYSKMYLLGKEKENN